MNDPTLTRRRLAQAQAALDADPENPDLIKLVWRLECAAEALEFHYRMQRLAFRSRLYLLAHESRN